MPEQLFAQVRFMGPIHDPACGEGRFVKTAWRASYEATGSDLEDCVFGEIGIDFREDFRPRVALVFTSPSGLHEVFIAHALDVASEAMAVIVRSRLSAPKTDIGIS